VRQVSAPKWLRTRPIAHRGLHDLGRSVPENSLAAFRRAVEGDYPIELDVRLLGDGGVAVYHDATLDRLTGRRAALVDLTSREASRVRLISTTECMPLLDDALDLVGGRVPLLIEVKNPDDRVGPLERGVLQRLQGYRGPVAVQSFNPYALRWFKAMAPEIPRGQLTCDFRREPLPAHRKFLLRNLLLKGVSAPSFVAFDIACLPHWRMPGLRRRKVTILGWTVRGEQEEAWARRHCDNIIFEGYRPSRRQPGQ
jgi:glycerophosphoryl diester phosphodiesterase